MLTPLLAIAALAHGPPPQAVGINAVDETGPVIVKLTEGAALRRDDGTWSFLCPALWGGVPERPLGRSPSATAHLHGAFALVSIPPDGTVTATGTPELGVTEIVETVRGSTHAWALRRSPELDELWRVSPPERMWTTPDRVTSLVELDGQIHVAVMRDLVLDVVTVDLGGSEGATETWDLDTHYTAGLRSAAGQLFLVERRIGDHELARYGPDGPVVIGGGTEEILGPVDLDGRALVAIDGLLHWIDGDVLTPTGAPEWVACLESVDGKAWACAYPDLHPVRSDGQLEEPIFRIDAIVPPNMARVPDAITTDCDIEWLRIAADLGLEETTAPSDRTGQKAGDEATGGCGGRSGFVFLLPIALCRRRRSSAHDGPFSF